MPTHITDLKIMLSTLNQKELTLLLALAAEELLHRLNQVQSGSELTS